MESKVMFEKNNRGGKDITLYNSGITNDTESEPMTLWASPENCAVYGFDHQGECVFEGGVSDDGEASVGTWPWHVFESEHDPDSGVFGPSDAIKRDMTLAIEKVNFYLWSLEEKEF